MYQICLYKLFILYILYAYLLSHQAIQAKAVGERWGKKVLELSASSGKGRKMNCRFGEFDIVALGEEAFAFML
jgi:hypothetical protein